MEFTETFFSIISSFPCSLPSVMLLVVLFYWILALIGLVDIDIFHGHFHMDGIEMPHGHADIAHGGHHEAGEVGLVASAVVSLGINGVPLSIVISAITLFTWILCYLSQRYLLMALPDLLRWTLGSVVLFVAFVASLPLCALALRPLRGAFAVHNAASNHSLIGHTCQVLTLEVNETFGQAHVKDKGAGYTIRVWSRTPNSLGKGSEAAVVGFDPVTQRFEIAEVAALDGPDASVAAEH